MNKANNTSNELYGISRIDNERHSAHAWRVSLRRHGKRHVKNFTDKKYGGSELALRAAKQYRDTLVKEHPPISRKEFCNIKRRHNKSGITGVYTYRKTYTLKDGTVKESWYWEANWPNENGESVSKSFPVNRFGDEQAKQMAINAREQGMRTVSGTFWAAERADFLMQGHHNLS